MAKRKNKDFNKTKLKLGRKLKKQHETVIDLSKKKIVLPKEKASPHTDFLNREATVILDEYIKNIQSSVEAVQLTAITSIQSIIGPFASQIRSCSRDPLVAPPTESLISAVKRLFGFDFALKEFNFQVGDLLNVIAKICQNSTSPRLASEVAQLCSNLTTIFGCHPRLHLILSCIDGIACLMLRRPEHWWRTAGCKLLSYVSMARCNVLQTLAVDYIHLTPCLSLSELLAFTNVSDQEYRSTTYLRLLARQFQLTEGSILNTTELKMHLLLACTNLLKDLQYTAFVTPLMFRNTAATITLHPFLRSTHLPEKELGCKHDANLTASSDASVLRSAWMLPNVELRTNPTLNAGFASFGSRADKSSQKGKFTSERSGIDDPSANQVALQSRRLAVYIINEGLRFLDELLHTPKFDTVHGLLCVVRCLRVFAETKGSTFFLNQKHLISSGHPQSWLPDVSHALSRFCRRLRDVVPLDVPEDQLLSQLLAAKTSTLATASVTRTGVVAPAVRSRREQKKAKQRAVKLVRRGQAVAAATTDVAMPDDELREADATPQGPDAPKRLDRCTLLTHLLKQACIELYWSLALLDCHAAVRFRELRDHENALHADSAVLTQLANLLTAEGRNDLDLVAVEEDAEVEALATASPADLPPPLRILSALTPLNPALSWRWLRVLDRIILHAHRSKSVLRDDMPSLAAFVAPSLVALWRTFHRWYLRCTAGGPGSLRAPRTVVRCAGLLTAFLCRELEEQAWTGKTSAYSAFRKLAAPPANETTGLTYDASWIGEALARSDIVIPASLCGADMFEVFCNDLAALISLATANSTGQSSSPKALLMDQSASSWIWVAVCLQNLINSQYSPAVSKIAHSSDQPTPVAELLCRLRASIDKDAESPPHLLSTCEPLVYLPAPSTGRYTAPRGWKCTSINRIAFTAKDVIVK